MLFNQFQFLPGSGSSPDCSSCTGLVSTTFVPPPPIWSNFAGFAGWAGLPVRAGLGRAPARLARFYLLSRPAFARRAQRRRRQLSTQPAGSELLLPAAGSCHCCRQGRQLSLVSYYPRSRPGPGVVVVVARVGSGQTAAHRQYYYRLLAGLDWIIGCLADCRQRLQRQTSRTGSSGTRVELACLADWFGGWFPSGRRRQARAQGRHVVVVRQAVRPDFRRARQLCVIVPGSGSSIPICCLRASGGCRNRLLLDYWDLLLGWIGWEPPALRQGREQRFRLPFGLAWLPGRVAVAVAGPPPGWAP